MMKLIKEMLEMLTYIYEEVRPEISRVNMTAGETIFNPTATGTIDMAKELISKVEGTLTEKERSHSVVSFSTMKPCEEIRATLKDCINAIPDYELSNEGGDDINQG